jgi:AraC-like DNA-binding protein
MESSKSSNSDAQQTEPSIALAQRSLSESCLDEVSSLWLRSANEYSLDPASHVAPHILLAGEIKAHREPLDKLIHLARGEINHLYAMIRAGGYVVLLCDMNGVAVDHRGQEGEVDQFSYWGTWLGGVWAESIEGTNGIGTCIAEERPVTVHRGQHFRARNKDLSCSSAPVFGVDGRMIAVLDVSAIDPNRSERALGLTGGLAMVTARAIEEQYFRDYYCRQWIVAVGNEESASAVLLAVDADQRIVGANRAARQCFALDESGLQAGISLWGLFERNLTLFRGSCDSDVVERLFIKGSYQACAAIITTPAPEPDRRRLVRAVPHTHSRLELVEYVRDSASPAQARGGLPPAAMRRLDEYMEAYLSNKIELPTLAAIANLSVYHFAREFKRSTGVTPHNYLLRKRVEFAKNMLTRTESSLAEVALATGFSDQSHLSRHFRQIIGATPRQFRWSRR